MVEVESIGKLRIFALAVLAIVGFEGVVMPNSDYIYIRVNGIT